ncbi:LysR family transcriptional regulator [Paludibacterium paludis]|uniref:Transcriptional regulator n=1 Tax=Paludibacterium paludis TaxID=1225769 RepID=A0A918NXU3_9NEIS|nr:LysR family transcriptional regulator [Paludibacterium paludis]GGY03050.1 transcriptional regulator [Paludibacterium paludis]
MHLSRIDLNLFVVFDAIYGAGGLTPAARQLSLTQPALSHALARLRDVFGDPLFVRQGSAMVPTPLARSLIGPVRQALQGLDASVNHNRSFDPETARRTFTIGLRDVLEATVLPPLMGVLRARAPDIDIAAVRADRRELERDLASGALDLAVDIALPLADRIRRRRIGSDRLVVVARGGNIDGLLTLERYLAASHVLVSSRSKGPGVEDMELNRHGHRRRIGLRCQHYFAACRVVNETNLLLTMPEQYAAIANRNLDNAIHAFPLSMPELDVYLYWHETVEHDAANAWLREMLLDGYPR